MLWEVHLVISSKRVRRAEQERQSESGLRLSKSGASRGMCPAAGTAFNSTTRIGATRIMVAASEASFAIKRGGGRNVRRRQRGTRAQDMPTPAPHLTLKQEATRPAAHKSPA